LRADSARSGQSVRPAPLNLPCLNRADRFLNTTLFVLAAAAWLAAGYVLTTLDPRGNTSAVIAGALLLGAAAALTVAPVLWILGFMRNRHIAYRGDWLRAARRASLVGLVLVLLVILRAQGALSLPIALLIVAMPVLIEVTLTARR
jgi:hypothetical protein